ncbi:PLP-dependent aminotransferase family protein [Pseudomonas alloputida]|uniref:aminotransferase-like domain-containing protein n=1 Tax=Pseudomonas TaxID=286 RepID=UPI003EEE7E0E
MQRFRQVAELLQKRIDSGVIAPGDKLPSLRRLASETGFSVVTVYRAYELLEAQGVCHSRDRSGFYVASPAKTAQHRMSPRMPVMPPDDVRSLDDGLARLPFHAKAAAAMLPASGLMPEAGLIKGFRRALLQKPVDTGHGIVELAALKTAIAQRAGQRQAFTGQDGVLLTRSAMEAFNLGLDSLSQGGAPVLVESPSFYPVLESLRHRRIKTVEIYSHPTYGVDPEQFEHILKSTGVKLCVLMGVNRFPTGVTYSGESLARLVRAARQNKALVIENDMAGELGHGELNTLSLKAFDDDDTVVQFGGTASYLSSAYEIGWVLAGRHAARLVANRHLAGTHLPHVALQAALADYLKGRQIERDLRHAGHALTERMNHGIELITAASSGRVAVSAPTGGYLCWVRGPRNFDSMKLAMTAGHDTFDFIPGPFFSPAGAFSNFMALNFSAPWSGSRRERLHRLVAQMLGNASMAG